MRKAAIWRGDPSAAFASPGRSAAAPQPAAAATKPALALPSSRVRRETGRAVARSEFGGSTMGCMMNLRRDRGTVWRYEGRILTHARTSLQSHGLRCSARGGPARCLYGEIAV